MNYITKKQINNKKEIDNDLLINRILLFSFCLFAIPVSFIYDVLGDETYSVLKWIMYFTIWANIFSFIWSSIAFFNIFKKSEKIDKIIENWFIKGTTIIFIFITGFVFNFVLIPWGLIYAKSFDGWTEFFGYTIIQHSVVPIFMTRDFFLTKGFVFNKNEDKISIIKKLTISTIIPLIWLITSLIFISLNIIEPQYPFMNLFETNSLELAINIIVLSIISISWLLLFGFLFLYSNNKEKREANNKNKKILKSK